MPGSPHRPVMLAEVVDALSAAPPGLVLDATVGLGGHTAALLERQPDRRVLGLDVDADALERASGRLAPFGDRARLVRASYRDVDDVLDRLGIEALAGALFDLGVSSLQLDTASRGFSFRHDAPLDMRFSGEGETAAELLERSSEEELVRVLRDLGEEPAARRIARTILRERTRGPIATTGELRRIVAMAVGGRPSAGPRPARIDPATRTFQALRIAVNGELEGLQPALERAARRLAPGGRLAVIAFHSLEDRIVKRTLRRLAGRCVCPPALPVCGCGAEELLEILTPRPLRPSDDEVRDNPRARSARLRLAVRRLR